MKLKAQIYQMMRNSVLFFSAALLILPTTVAAATIALTNIATETVQASITGGTAGEYSWASRYDIGFSAATGSFNVDLRIRLYGDDPGSELKSIWEQGIENIWSSQFKIVQDGAYAYDVNFDVEFIDSFSGMHHLVTVHSGTGAMNMTNWYTQNPSGWSQSKQGEAAAHEAGHMFGNFDEYASGAVNPDGSYSNVSDSLMGSQLTQSLFPRHYQFVADWAAGKKPGEAFVVSDLSSSLSSPPLPSAVPVPPAIYLFMSGILGLLGLSRSQKSFLNRA